MTDETATKTTATKTTKELALVDETTAPGTVFHFHPWFPEETAHVLQPVTLTFPSGAEVVMGPGQTLTVTAIEGDFVRFVHSAKDGKFKTTPEVWASAVAPHVTDVMDADGNDLAAGPDEDPAPEQPEPAGEDDDETVDDGPIGIIDDETPAGTQFVLPEGGAAIFAGFAKGRPGEADHERRILMHWADDGMPAFDEPITLNGWNTGQAIETVAVKPSDGRGLIDEATPVGRIVGLSTARPPEVPCHVYRMVRITDGRVYLAEGPEGDGDELTMTMDDWNEQVAPFVVLATDPQIETATEETRETASGQPSAEESAIGNRQSAISSGPCVSVPIALIKAAQDARRNLTEAQEAFAMAAEARRQAKDDLESKQEIYNTATVNVITYRTKGFDPASPMGRHIAEKSAEEAPEADAPQEAPDPDAPAEAPESESVSLEDLEAPPADPVDPNAWRDESIDGLELGTRAHNALLKAGLETMGKLADWMQKKADFWAKDIKGIGPDTAETISDAMVDFWARHPEHCDNEAA